MLTVDRHQAMAYRVAAHGLHRSQGSLADLTVLDLGIQDAQQVSARLAIAARADLDPTTLAKPAFADSLADARVTLAWTHRGAPHLHHAADLADLAAAMVPLDDTDALARLSWQRRDVEQAGAPATEAMRTAVHAMRKAVDTTMTKGAASERVTKLLPEGLVRWCRGCQATHIHEQLMRLTTLRAGIRLEPDVAPATLTPLPDAAFADTPSPAANRRVAANYLRLHGPAGVGEVAGFIGTTRRLATDMWPEDVVEVEFDGRPAFAHPAQVELLADPPEPDIVRLLPPSDPLLQARDRATLVPDRELHKQVWRVIGNPGAVLAGGEIAGTWRPRAKARTLGIAVTAFHPLGPQQRQDVEAEAARVGQARGFDKVAVTFD